jgi:hypothetical protein
LRVEESSLRLLDLKDHPDDVEGIGNGMLHEWERGVAFSLKTA